MKERVSKPIIAIAIVGLLVAGLMVWRMAVRHPDANAANEQASGTPAATTEREGESAAADDRSAGASTAAAEKTETALTNLVPLPLTAILAEAENGMWVSNKDYLSLPRGIQTFGGIEFHLDGMLQMQGKGSEAQGRKYRKQISLPLKEAGAVNARIGS